MADPRFDPTKAVTFDLEHGLVHLEGAPARIVVPAEGLMSLCASAGQEAAAAFGRNLGEAIGRRIARRLASGDQPAEVSVREASVEVMVDQLGGELSLTGLGSLGLERWGRALVLVVDHCPLGRVGDSLLESILEGAVTVATGRPARVVGLGREEVRTRFLVTGAGAVDRVRAWIGAGTSWGEVIARLHGPTSASPRRGEA